MFRSTICLALLAACALAMPQEYTPAQVSVQFLWCRWWQWLERESHVMNCNKKVPQEYTPAQVSAWFLWWQLESDDQRINNKRYTIVQTLTTTTPQLLVIRQHEAIAAANTPSVFETLPGWDQHQVRCLTPVLFLNNLESLKHSQGLWDSSRIFCLKMLRRKSDTTKSCPGRLERCSGSAGNLPGTERPRRRHRQVVRYSQFLKFYWLLIAANVQNIIHYVQHGFARRVLAQESELAGVAAGRR